MKTIRILNRYWPLPAVISLLVETGLLATAVWIAYGLRSWLYFGTRGRSVPYFDTHLPARVATFVLVVLLCMYFADLYNFEQRLGLRQIYIRLLRAFALSLGVLMMLYYATGALLTIGRTTLVMSIALSAVFVVASRHLLSWVLRKSWFRNRVLIVGAGTEAISLAEDIERRRHLGYEIVGFLDETHRLIEGNPLNGRVIGTPCQARELALDKGATSIIVAMNDKRGRLSLNSLLECKTNGISVLDGPSFYEQLIGKISLDGLRLSWLVFSEGFFVSGASRIAKRTLDLLVSSLLLIPALPVMVVIALVVPFESAGPALYRQRRVGLRGKPFTLLKFRSMVVDAEAPGKPRWAKANDERVTRLGRVLRKFRLDELPQLWNVLEGDMSLVGPRPERPPMVAQLKQKSIFYEHRHEVRPGLTGWAQIMAPYASTFDESLEKLEYDLFYIKNISLLLDLSILASTARIVLLGRGAR